MMYNPLFTVLLVAPLSLAVQPNPRVLPNALVARQPFSLNPRIVPNALLARQSCSSSGEATCDQSCMPIDAVCCNDGSSTFCPNGESCVPGGCCSDGETCDGSGGGTLTLDNPKSTSILLSSPTTSLLSGGSASCSSSGEATCDQSCMPIDAVCCNDGSSTYCPNGESCVANGCCPDGEVCDGSGGGTVTLGGSSATPTFNTASLSSKLDTATGISGALSDLPTLPASIQSILITAIPASALTASEFACDPTAAAWYSSLPGNVKSALSSYGSEVSSWASKHSSGLGTYTDVPVCTGTRVAANTNAATTGSGTTSGSSSTATGSPGTAPRVTRAISGSVAGVVGVLGLMAVL
ncbi:hypothetical protein BDZ45DRAFT_671865 [Acephala macrosclerotiorum]|nr:hypothetical protein BDZ45DRAFT_671865 [Acephala macrosclerotiorum]